MANCSVTSAVVMNASSITPSDSSPKVKTIGEIITDILYASGIHSVIYGIGGDYVSAFLSFLDKKFSLISSSSELSAGYSAIANSILTRKISATVVTWNVGSLAQLENMKYAKEYNVPILFISGGLGSEDRGISSVHHSVSSIKSKVDDTMVSVNAAKSVGVHAFSLFPEHGILLIDGKKVLNAQEDAVKIAQMLKESLVYLKNNSKPVYIEIPRDLPIILANDNFSEQIIKELVEHKEQNAGYREEFKTEDLDFLSALGLPANVVRTSQSLSEIKDACKPFNDCSTIKKVIGQRLKNAIFIADNHRGIGMNYVIASCQMAIDSVPVLFTTEDLFEKKGVNELIKLAQIKKRCLIILFARRKNNYVYYSTIAQKAGLLGNKITTYLGFIEVLENFLKNPQQSSLLLEIEMDLYPAMFEEKIENLSIMDLKGTFSEKLLHLLNEESCRIVYKGDHYNNSLLAGIFACDPRFKIISSPDAISAGYAAAAAGKRSYNLGIGLFDSVTGANGIANAIAENYPMLVLFSPRHKSESTIQTAETLGIKTMGIDSFTINPAESLMKIVHYAKENSEPVYIEISKDVLLSNYFNVMKSTAINYQFNKTVIQTEARTLIAKVKNIPQDEKIFIYLGEKFAFNPTLVDLIKEFSEQTHIPIASSLVIKSAFPEDFHLNLGTYWGPFSKMETVLFVHQASYVIRLGEAHMQKDLSSGFGAWEMKKDNSFIFKGEHVNGKDLEVFIQCLIEEAKQQQIPKRDFPDKYKTCASLLSSEDYKCYLKKKITLRDYYKVVATYISRNNRADIVNLFDCGTAWFGSFGMYSGTKDSYFASNFYASMGFAVPALSAITEVQPDKFPILTTGDGAFQMTGFSGMFGLVKAKKRAFIVIFRNDKYALGSRLASPINVTAVDRTSYSGMIKAMGGNGIDNLQTFQDLVDAIEKARESDVPTLVEIRYNNDTDKPRESWLVDTWIAMMRGEEKAKAMWEKIRSGEISDVSD